MSTPKSKRVSRTLAVVGVWLAFLALAEAGYRVIGWAPWIFPAPSHVLDALLAMLNQPTYFGEPLHTGWPWQSEMFEAVEKKSVLSSPLATALPISGVRLMIGFIVALALGMGFGLAMWRFTFVDALLGPAFLGLQTLPSVCWVPLAVLVLGIDERGILFVLVMGSFFAIAIALRDGMRTVPPIYRTAGLMLGARRVRLYRDVLLPSSFPALAGTLRQGFSFAWRSLMGAELILLVQNRGLGFELGVGREFNDVARVVAVMIVMVAVGMAADRFVFAVLERRVRMRFGLIASA